MLSLADQNCRNDRHPALKRDRELGRQRLKSKFPWIGQPEHVVEREICYRPPGLIQKAVERSFEFLWDYVQTELPGPSRVDVRYVAYALESGGTVVTDDLHMRKLAKEFEVRAMSSLQLLRLLQDNGVVTPKTVRGLVEYWRFQGDTPSNMDAEYRRLFGEKG